MIEYKMICEIIYYIMLSLGVLIGGIFSLYQWHNQVKIKKAEFLDGTMKSILDDKDIVEVIYAMEYNSDWFIGIENRKKFHNSVFEKKVDKTLSRYSYFTTLCEKKLINEIDFDFVKYTIERILRNQSTQEYLMFLFNFSINNSTFFAYSSLINYGKKRGIIDENVFLIPQNAT